MWDNAILIVMLKDKGSSIVDMFLSKSRSESRVKERSRSLEFFQTSRITKCWKVIMGCWRHYIKDKLLTPALNAAFRGVMIFSIKHQQSSWKWADVTLRCPSWTAHRKNLSLSVFTVNWPTGSENSFLCLVWVWIHVSACDVQADSVSPVWTWSGCSGSDRN